MKYIIFDLDDTLLNNDKKISDFTLKILKTLQNSNKIIINTARSLEFSREFIELLRPDYSILNGGSLIIDKNENILYKEIIDKNTIQKLIKILLNNTYNFTLYTLKEVFSSDPTYKGQNAQYFDFNNEKFEQDCFKIVLSPNEFFDANDISELNLQYVPYLSGKFGRINLKNTSKDNGNRKLMEILNASLNDCIVFGDDVGDLKMIQEAGTGVLMFNATETLKKEVKNITTYNNNEDGVAKFLVDFFKLENN